MKKADGFLSVRTMTWEDFFWVWSLARDPVTREGSLDRHVPGFFDHFRWFRRWVSKGRSSEVSSTGAHSLRDNRRRAMVLVMAFPGEGGLNMVNVGLYRIGPSMEGGCECGVAIVPEWRGHGLATEALEMMLPWSYSNGGRPVWARIRLDNIASRKSFERAGFRRVVQPPPSFRREGVGVWSV